MARRGKLVTALVLILLCGGLAGWAWYLSGRSLQDAGNASSVLGGFAAVVFGVTGVVLGVAALRQTTQRAGHDQGAGGNGPVMGDRAVYVPGRVRGNVFTGDHTTITGWSPRAAWVIGLVMVLAASASVASVVVALRGDGPSQPVPVRVGAYTVTVRGSAIGGDPFELQGELRVRRPTDGQPYEWCLKVGNPWGAPKPGAVWFGTNGTCFGSGVDRAVATVREMAGEHVLTPVDPPPSLRDGLNAFTATSGLLSGVYVPDGGDVRFRASPSRLEGTLSLQGLEALAGRSTHGTFTATFTAALLSDDPEALVSSPIDPKYGDGARPAGPPEVKGVRYTVRTIISFTPAAGSEAFLGPARTRFAEAVFVINARDGGEFVYDPPNSRDDVFPITGTVTGNNPVFVLAGTRSAGEGVTAASAEIGGILDLSGASPVARLRLRTTLGVGTTSGYEVEAILQ